MEDNTKTNEQYATERADKISKSKIYGDGHTPCVGILDILFLDSATEKITRYEGQTAPGRIIILLPFRTPRNLTKWASYGMPSDWKLKFEKGAMINAVIENGYVTKLVASHKFMPKSTVIDIASATATAEADAEAVEVEEVEEGAVVVEGSAPVVQTVTAEVPAGFEDEDGPF